MQPCCRDRRWCDLRNAAQRQPGSPAPDLQSSPGPEHAHVLHGKLQDRGRQGHRCAGHLTIARVDFDDPTQKNLSNLGAAIAQTQIAIQNEKTAKAQGAANAALNAQPATGTTLTQLCIQATLEMAKDGHPPSGAWNCFGPTPTVTTTNK